jgi:hypothetical protein
LFGLYLLIAPFALHAGQEVRILVEADEQGRLQEHPAALEQALQLGVFQEAQALLQGQPGQLDGVRQGLLRELLSGKAPEYVLSFGQQEPELTAWGAVLRFEVHVNRQALRDFLQAIGLYFTLERSVGYALVTEGLSVADAALVANMEALSGLQRGGANTPVLRLSRTPGRDWQGVLDFEGLVWTAQSPDLPELWASLWGNYFALGPVRQLFEQRVLLTTAGWGTVLEAQGFDRMLRGWNVEAGLVRLIDMNLGPQGLQVRWEIITRDRAGLETRLGPVLREKNISYAVQ